MDLRTPRDPNSFVIGRNLSANALAPFNESRGIDNLQQRFGHRSLSQRAMIVVKCFDMINGAQRHTAPSLTSNQRP